MPRPKQGRAIPTFDRLLQVRSGIEYECSFWGQNLARRPFYMNPIPLTSLPALLSVNRASSVFEGGPHLPAPLPASVVLRDQKMTLERRARSGMMEANLRVPTACGMHSTGHPRIQLANAQLGPSPMPQALAEGRAAAIDDVLDASISTAALGFPLESVNISDGILTFTGRAR
jgi:hypothetical protein